MHAVRAVRAARSYGSACEQGLAWGPGGPKELQKKTFWGRNPSLGLILGLGSRGYAYKGLKGSC